MAWLGKAKTLTLNIVIFLQKDSYPSQKSHNLSEASL